MKELGQAIMDALPMNSMPSLSEPHYCSICGVFVPQMMLTVLGKTRPVQPVCKCEAQAQDMNALEPQKLKEQRDIESKFSISNLGERFTDSTFDKFKPIPGTEKAFDVCKSYADTFPSHGENALMLWGTYGCGKSHLAASVAHSVKEKGHTCVFQTLPELLERIRQTFNDRSNKEKEKDIMNALQNCTLLILDDIGAEKVSDWVQDVLFRIVDGRYRQKKPILYTTNLKPSELKDRVGPRIYDRMIETSILVENKADSYRFKIAEERYRGA